MVFSYYLYKYPYKLIWHFLKSFRHDKIIAFYCADPLDYEMFLPISKYLPPVKIIAKNKKVKKYLSAKNIEYVSMPFFPDVVIMARQMPYKFPVKKIIKFGFDHGLYQFKRWTSSRNYNEFDMYFVSSEAQVKKANVLGIYSVRAIGYPKNDNAFSGIYDEHYLNSLRTKLNLDSNKKTILFSTTWNVDGLSQIDKWIYRIDELSTEYNILTTTHTWIDEKYKNYLKQHANSKYIDDYDITPYLMIADILVGDYNSLIGEFCAFLKPIITFAVPVSSRTVDEVIEIIRNISYQVNTFDELKAIIERALKNPSEKLFAQKEANKIFFYKLDGLAGRRAADKMLNYLKNKGIKI